VTRQLEEWWERFAYLSGRYPLPMNSNFCVNFGQINSPGTRTRRDPQVEVAARLARFVLEMRDLIDKWGGGGSTKCAGGS
jgi:hypothetical protein